MSKPGFAKFFLSLWIALSLILPAQAAEMCQYVFSTPEVRARPVDFGLRTDSTHVTPIELVKFAETKAALWATLEKLPQQRRESIEHLLAAVEFFDYTHTAAKLIPNFLDGKRESFDFSRLYDGMEAIEGTPFKSFLSARDNYLRKNKPDVSAEILVEIHKRIMENGVENVQSDQLGVWRNAHWRGNAADSWRLTAKEVEAIQQNPYLFFTKNADNGKSPLKHEIWEKVKIWGSQKDMNLAKTDVDIYGGSIHYPYVGTPKQSTIDIIKDSHPELYLKLLIFRQENPPSTTTQAPRHLEQAFTKALVEERFSRFQKEREALGEIKIGLNEHKYIDIVADLQRDLVAIHPVLNGNGRTTRLLMNYLLTREGLPPVRLVDPFLDVQVSQKEWREYVHKGVINSAQLQTDVLYRIQNGLTVEYSPDLIYPGLPETISVALKKQGSIKETPNYGQAKVDASQFNAFLKTLTEMHPELRMEIQMDRVRAMSRIADLFVEYYRSKTIRYMHEKDGEQEVSLRLVDPDFVETFGINKSYSKQLWDQKISRWYDKDMLVWRGLSHRTTEYTNEQLLKYFTAPSAHLASNRAVRAVQNGETVLKAIKDDFKLYNQESINGKVVEMATDHHRTGPRYGESYGYSTSKREVVGKAFAMGAMVIGEYGKHMDPTLQAKLKSRVNVASFRALKDVDLGRLKAFDSDFSYSYGRQAEVMGIGGTDADAVAIIQKIDATGVVKETLLRNFQKPDEVLLIEGRYVPGEGPLAPERIKERFTLPRQEAQEIKSSAPKKIGDPRKAAWDILNKFFNGFK